MSTPVAPSNALSHGVVDHDELMRRVGGLPLPRRQREHIVRLLRGFRAA